MVNKSDFLSLIISTGRLEEETSKTALIGMTTTKRKSSATLLLFSTFLMLGI
jgi:hypothetical protein